ncbi:MAG: ABC transporter permease [Candidatus Brocadiia bacterium]|nr:MAG: ABC transporter permease [Candidatus Brocadiia bacterium]
MLNRLLSNYGMLLILIALCVFFSLLTLKKQMPTGDSAVAQVLQKIGNQFEKDEIILAAGAVGTDSSLFAQALNKSLKDKGFKNSMAVIGTPRDLRLELDRIKAANKKVSAIVVTGDVTKWLLLTSMAETYPNFSDCRILTPKAVVWSVFLKSSNLLAIVDRIVVIAIMAIGMTMVIITGGIDLSVGSLTALSAVIGALVMKHMGGPQASGWVVLIGFLVGILCCGAIGCLGGFVIAKFNVAPFITTLGVMMMARGLAFVITGGFSIYQVPKALPSLGQGATLGIPNTVILLVLLYLLAHIFMSHTPLGRYIYAVGGNREATRLSGVPVSLVIFFVYIVSSLSAGLGGCIQASQLNTGTPNIGTMYELYVIAAVVVGGTTLSGGKGKMLGTLIGALIISVIQNGMNLLGIESYTQQIVLGGVIVGAVLLDKLRSRG